MTIWQPDIASRPGPRYLAIADALAEDIRLGRLPEGQRLPTHRDLAYRLDVTVGTVSRAYAEAERRGLIAGEIGRGTYVRGKAEGPVKSYFMISHGVEPDLIDMSLNLPASDDASRSIAGILASIAQTDLSPLLSFSPDIGHAEHRETGTAWIAATGWQVDPKRIVITNGVQHAMTSVLMAIAQPGDTILTENLTYPGIKSLASHLGLKLEGLPMDGEGLIPEAVERACLRLNPKALYCMPTLQNPTTAMMPAERRREIASIAERHGLFVIEDDIYGLLPEQRPLPLASYLPDLGFYLASLSKSLAAGLRIGYVAAPAKWVAPVAAAVRSTCWMATPLMAEIVRRCIAEGLAERISNERRIEMKARKLLAEEKLGRFAYRSHPDAFHLWLPLPEPWRAEEFAAELKRQGVLVRTADVFAIGRDAPQHWVRIALGSLRERREVARGLDIIAATLDAGPKPHLSVV